MIEGGVAVSHALSIDRDLYKLLDHTYDNSLGFYEAYDNQLRDRVNNFVPVNNQIRNINIITNNKSILSGGNYYIINQEVMDSDWYKQWISYTGQLMVTTYRGSDVINPASIVPYLSIVKRMDYFTNLNYYTKLIKIDLDIRKVYEIIIREQEYMKLYLVNGSNQIIMSADHGYLNGKEDSYAGYDLSQLEGKENVHIVSVGNASYMKGLRIVGVPEEGRISSSIRDMWLFAGFLAATITFVAFLFIFALLRSYNYRVKRLSRHMQKLTNEKFDLIHMDEGRDEIGELIRNYNTMTTKINSLINDVYKLEIQKKDLEVERVRAELNFLQSQMNPHFLFNTLNAILVVCTKNNYSEVTDIIKNLSKILRRLLSWKEDAVTLEEELSFIEMYLKIEKFRFRDKIQYQFEIDEQTLKYRIPKMSIQPLVENACKHGLQTIEGQGIIMVRVVIRDLRLCVSVMDNGKGMEESKLREIMLSIRSDSLEGENVGIRNVYRRLELYYNDQVQFNLSSSPNQGMEVSFEIPLKYLNQT
ncbi:sensor histidine kinase [Paenibacillus sp. CMAA1364]